MVCTPEEDHNLGTAGRGGRYQCWTREIAGQCQEHSDLPRNSQRQGAALLGQLRSLSLSCSRPKKCHSLAKGVALFELSWLWLGTKCKTAAEWWQRNSIKNVSVENESSMATITSN